MNHIYQSQINRYFAGMIEEDDWTLMLARYVGLRDEYNAELARREYRKHADAQWLGYGLENFNAFFGDAK